MAPPAGNRDANLTKVFYETATLLAEGKVVYALVRYEMMLIDAMAPQRNWISREDRELLQRMKRWPAVRVFGALAQQFWMPENVRAMGKKPELSMKMRFGY